MTAADLKDLVEGYRRLSTANVSDGLDRAGIAGAPHGIGPLWDGCTRIVGPAATLKLVPAGRPRNRRCSAPWRRSSGAIPATCW